MAASRFRLPLARWGARELLLYGGPLLLTTMLIIVFGGPWAPVALAPGLAGLGVIWFFRDPHRDPPPGQGHYVSPADGRVVEVATLPACEFIGGPTVRISLFLSLLDVHVNRAPTDCRVLRTDYTRGRYHDARNPLSARENEHQWTGFEEPDGARFAVRQVSGAVARRIVCAVGEGDRLARGQRFGMIKFGSRAELILPAGVQVLVQVGERVKAGQTVLATR